MLLKDFNAYYFFWEDSHAVCKTQSKYLYTTIIVNDLSLLTLRELSIWKRDNWQSVIDFIFILVVIKKLIQFCNLMNHWVIT